jgi:dipeptidyl aminopeptidase/acylaminoacyl peptidase
MITARLLRTIALVFPLALAACGSSADHASAPSPATPDGGSASDAAAGGAGSSDPDASATGSRASSACVVDASGATCEHMVTTVSGRTVAYASPHGVAPAAGWPAVLYFQGSFVAGDTAFAAVPGAQFGMYQLTLTIKSLLDRGYAVVAPDASGSSVWETNVPPYAQSWSGSSDDVFMEALFAAMASGTLGRIDPARLYAMGISSGGFMTSRMAVSYAGRFRALADHSGSYATCSTLCNVPTPLPSDHPPILFLRGEQDMLVPGSSVTPYLDALVAEGHEARLVTDPAAGHEWLAAGVTAIPAWFDAHP